jgi:hypothetical protein
VTVALPIESDVFCLMVVMSKTTMAEVEKAFLGWLPRPNPKE